MRLKKTQICLKQAQTSAIYEAITQICLKQICLSQTDLAQTDLSHTDLAQTDLAQTDLSQTDLSQTDLSQTYLAQTDLAQTDLSQTLLMMCIGERQGERRRRDDICAYINFAIIKCIIPGHQIQHSDHYFILVLYYMY